MSEIHIILSKDITNLGSIGEVVKVKTGYARNFLFPQGVALPISLKRVKLLAHHKNMIERKKIRIIEESKKMLKEIKSLKLSIISKATGKGKLFGSITNKDIEAIFIKNGYNINYNNIVINKPIKTIGSHSITITLLKDIETTINIMVKAPVDES